MSASMTGPALAAWADCEVREKAAATGELLRRELRRGKSEEKGRKKDWSRGGIRFAKEDGETLARAIPITTEQMLLQFRFDSRSGEGFLPSPSASANLSPRPTG
jgi:hypothetical protein